MSSNGVPSSPARTAAVLGGGVAGLLAAHVLARSFERVLVIERDAPGHTVCPRRGAPQGHHAHLLLLSGLRALEALLPGFELALRAAGAREIDTANDFLWFHHDCWKRCHPSRFRGFLMSRPLLEGLIRQRLEALPNVEVRYETVASGLVLCERSQRVRAVKLRSMTETGALDRAHLEPVAVVVDASGRGSQLPRWLREAGLEGPSEERVGLDLLYATRTFEPSPELYRDVPPMLLYPAPPYTRRMGLLFPVEGGRWIVTVSGYTGEHPGSDDDGFRAFADTLPQPDLARAIAQARPTTGVATFRFPTARWLRYDRRPALGGLLPMGDAVASFDPVYGQGMSVAALEAAALARHLEQDPELERGALFLERQARIIAAPWLVACSEGLRYPNADGHRPFWLPWLQRYTHHVHRLAGEHDWAFDRLLEVLHMLVPPAAFFTPRLAASVAWRALRTPRSAR